MVILYYYSQSVSSFNSVVLYARFRTLRSGVHRCMREMFLINSHALHTSVCKTNLTVVVDTNCMYKYVSYTNLLVPMSMCCVHVCCVHALVVPSFFHSKEKGERLRLLVTPKVMAMSTQRTVHVIYMYFASPVRTRR